MGLELELGILIVIADCQEESEGRSSRQNDPFAQIAHWMLCHLLP